MIFRNLLWIIFVWCISAAFACAEDVVLVGGMVIDGSGKGRATGNVRIRNGKVEEIGPFRPRAGEATIDAKGLVIAPGFIDVHNHSTGVLDHNLGAVSQITQGITTAVLGLDGEGPVEVENFMAGFDENPPAFNILTLVGHNTVRREVLGTASTRVATADEILRMEERAKDAMGQGAFGLSSNLGEGPGAAASLDELVALARAIARYGGVYVVHLRNEGDKVVQAVLEAIDIGRRAKVPVHISHLKLNSEAMWGKAAAVLAEIDKARRENIDVTADVFPYDTSDTNVTSMSGKDVRTLLAHASVMVASDAGIESLNPRGAGTFPRVLGSFVRDEKVLTLENAIRKMSGLPAARLGLKGRGLLVKGAIADVVVFDPARIRDLATPQAPTALSEGMKYVFVNGVMVVKDGQATAARPGLALR